MRFSVGVVAVFLVASTVVVRSPATAQSNTLLQLRTGGANDRLVVDTAGALLVTGGLYKASSLIPPAGPGARLVFWPGKAAFRAGFASSTQWDDGNAGTYSVGLGYATTASGSGAFAAAYGDSATGTGSVALGYYSSATGYASSALGYQAHASGQYAVALGNNANADTTNAVAIGNHASSDGHRGAIVIADWSGTSATFPATADNQFSVRASGGYRLFTNSAATVGAKLDAGATAWDVISDRNRKQDFLAVDGEDVLTHLRDVSVTTWRLRDEADRSVRHIGPVAQEWQAAFGFRCSSTARSD